MKQWKLTEKWLFLCLLNTQDFGIHFCLQETHGCVEMLRNLVNFNYLSFFWERSAKVLWAIKKLKA